MKWANVEQAKSLEIVDQDIVVNSARGVLLMLPNWLDGRLSIHHSHVFSSRELDAIAISSKQSGGIKTSQARLPLWAELNWD